MADHTKTLTNSINCFGGSPSTVWGGATVRVMTWGVAKWGEGTHAMIRDFVRGTYEQPITVTDSLTEKEFIKAWADSLTFLSETTNEGLQTQNGYSYVFVKPSTNAEDRNLSSYTSQTPGSVSYTSLTVSVTTWS